MTVMDYDTGTIVKVVPWCSRLDVCHHRGGI